MPTSPDALPDYAPTLDPVTTCEGALAHSLHCAGVYADDARAARRRALVAADDAARRGASPAILARVDAAAARAADYAARTAEHAAHVADLVRAGRAALAAGELEYAGRCAGGAADVVDSAYAAAHGAEESEDDAEAIARVYRR